ncbi:MAG: hypothetical protein FWE24_08990 [Defluviitaleaceae bacterium]|nr:hypothetical protein [Defluviitaleaceae bacterium]
MRRDDKGFDKPPSYHLNNKNNWESKNLRSSSKSTEPSAANIPENVVPIKKKEIRRKPSSKVAKGRRIRRTDMAVLTIALMLFTLALGFSLIRYITRGHTEIAVVGYGSVNITRVMNGIIVRDETVYTAPASGEVVFNVADGERVRRGAVVSSIENTSGITPLVAQSEELSRRIIDMQNLREDISIVSEEVAGINDNIRIDLDSRLLGLSYGNRETLYAFRNSLDQNIAMRNDRLLNENTGALRPLVDEHRQYASRIEENRTLIVATGGGIVSHRVDGFEDVLNPRSLGDITREQTRMYVGRDSFVQNRNVDTGDVVFKIVESNIWYIVAYIENDLITDWANGSAVRLYIEKGGGFAGHPFWVEDIRRGENESFVVLRTDRQIQDFLDMRTVSFKTYDSIYSGLKVPETAIVERMFLKIPRAYVETVRHNIEVVNRRAGSTIEQVSINTKVLRGIYREEGYVYIMQDFDNIRRGDVILLGSDDEIGYTIDELVSARGVFRTNTGIATFVSVNTEGMMSGDQGYVILDPYNNRGGIIQQDRIIRDAVSEFIREGAIVNH